MSENRSALHRLGRATKWIHRRWGQMLCFGCAAGFLFLPASYGDPLSAELPRALAAGFLLLAGCALKAVAFWRWREI